MKRIFILLLVSLLLLCSCSEPEQTFGDITDTAALKEYYSKEVISDWRVISALYLEGADISEYRIALSSDGSVYGDANCAISCAVLTSLFGVDGYDASAYLSSLEEAVRVPYDVPTLDLSMALMALYVCDKKPQMLTPALSHLEEIQLSDGGWGKDKDDKARDAYISAMVLNVITAYRKEYSDDNSRDELLTFLGNCIQNDNTIQDGTGASSSLATVGVLNSLIFAGIPANGEISTALCTAVSEYTAGGTFANYKNGPHSEDATAEVFLAFATARRASIFSFFSDEYKDMVNQSK